MEIALYPIAAAYGVALMHCLIKRRFGVFAGLSAFAIYYLATSPNVTFAGM